MFKKRPIQAQIEEYIRFKRKLAPIAADLDQDWLKRFARYESAQSVEAIELSQILRYRERVWLHGTQYQYQDFLRAIRCFLRYYKARKYPCLSPTLIERH